MLYVFIIRIPIFVSWEMLNLVLKWYTFAHLQKLKIRGNISFLQTIRPNAVSTPSISMVGSWSVIDSDSSPLPFAKLQTN